MIMLTFVFSVRVIYIYMLYGFTYRKKKCDASFFNQLHSRASASFPFEYMDFFRILELHLIMFFSLYLYMFKLGFKKKKKSARYVCLFVSVFA